MGSYIIKRLLLMIPTLLGVMLLTFAVIQFVPGGPIERIIAQLEGNGSDADARLNGGGGEVQTGNDDNSTYRGAKGLDPEFIKKLEIQFGFDKPPIERFLLMIKNYATFNFVRTEYFACCFCKTK